MSERKFPPSVTKSHYLFIQNPALVIGSSILAFIILVSLVGPVISRHATTEQHILKRLQGPSLTYLFGTDQYGRDLLSRTLLGGRTSLILGLGAVALGLVLGIPIGLITGYFKGRTDEIVMRFMDILLSFPSLLMALLIITALGASLSHAILAIGIANCPGIARIVRSATLSVGNEEFVFAAEARGESHFYIMASEIFPNILPPTIIEGTIRIGFAMLIGASLSFLGLGVQPPHADWGLMIRDSREYLFLSPWPLICPGIALAVTIIGFNLFGDGLRDMVGGSE
jgi:peptide/nickel transport system permease protein